MKKKRERERERERRKSERKWDDGLVWARVTRWIVGCNNIVKGYRKAHNSWWLANLSGALGSTRWKGFAKTRTPDFFFLLRSRANFVSRLLARRDDVKYGDGEWISRHEATWQHLTWLIATSCNNRRARNTTSLHLQQRSCRVELDGNFHRAIRWISI